MAGGVTLIGPQRTEPTLAAVVASLGLRGRLAAITAGWEEREGEDQELRDHLGGRVVNLRVHERCERIYQADAELFAAMQQRFDRMRRLQELYRVRLAHALDAARTLLARRADAQFADLADSAGAEALDDVRALDRRHFELVAGIHREFEERWKPLERSEVARARDEVARELSGCEALCIAGGHVTVLLNRVRLLGIAALLGERPLIAWSAGAMIATRRVVLFHDSPPQGAGNAEVLEQGLGLAPGVVALPHADKRLRLMDRARVELFARRFAPDLCAVLVRGARLDWDGARWCGAPSTRSLGTQGELDDVGLCEAAP
jgi:hypothetical protein